MVSSMSVAYPDEILRSVADRMAVLELGVLPVVDPSEPTRLDGLLTQFDLLNARQKLLEEERHAERVLTLRRVTVRRNGTERPSGTEPASKRSTPFADRVRCHSPRLADPALPFCSSRGGCPGVTRSENTAFAVSRGASRRLEGRSLGRRSCPGPFGHEVGPTRRVARPRPNRTGRSLHDSLWFSIDGEDLDEEAHRTERLDVMLDVGGMAWDWVASTTASSAGSSPRWAAVARARTPRRPGCSWHGGPRRRPDGTVCSSDTDVNSFVPDFIQPVAPGLGSKCQAERKIPGRVLIRVAVITPHPGPSTTRSTFWCPTPTAAK